jgi:hypothetical protein
MKSSPRENDDLLSRTSASVTVTPEDLNLQIEQAQRLLMEHERQLDDINRQKVFLEDIKRKQIQLDEGLRMVSENLNRGLVVLEGQEHQIRKEIEQVEFVRHAFEEQIHLVRQINPHQWNSKNPSDELTRALAILDQARLVYEQSRSKIDALRSIHENNAENDEQRSSGGSFLEKVSMGFAFSLPLLIALGLLILVLLFK